MVTIQEGSSALSNPPSEEVHSVNPTISELAQSDRHYIDAPPDQGAHHQPFVRISAGDSYSQVLSFLPHFIMKKDPSELIVKCEVSSSD